LATRKTLRCGSRSLEARRNHRLATLLAPGGLKKSSSVVLFFCDRRDSQSIHHREHHPPRRPSQRQIDLNCNALLGEPCAQVQVYSPKAASHLAVWLWRSMQNCAKGVVFYGRWVWRTTIADDCGITDNSQKWKLSTHENHRVCFPARLPNGALILSPPPKKKKDGTNK
jgi:hypothetical protein